MIAIVPSSDTIPFDALSSLNACAEAREWLRSRESPSWSAAWATCERGDWMLWLLGRLVRRDAIRGRIPRHGGPSHRRLVGCLVDVVWALAWPWLHDRPEEIRDPVEATLKVLERYADGEDVSRQALAEARFRAWAARSTAWARYAAAADAAAYAADADADAAAAYAYAAAAADAYAAAAADAAAAAADADAADARRRESRAEGLRTAADIVREWYPEAPALGGRS